MKALPVDAQKMWVRTPALMAPFLSPTLLAHNFDALGAALASALLVSAFLGLVLGYVSCRVVIRLNPQKTGWIRGLLLLLCVAVSIGVAVAAFCSMLRPAYELWDGLL